MLSVRAYAASRHVALAGGIRQPVRLANTTVRPWVRAAGVAADVPWLGSTMTPLMLNGPPGAKLTIVVVGDGFAAADQDAYNAAVDSLLMQGIFQQDFFAANRAAFNLFRINLVSADSGVGTKTYNAAGSATAQTDRNTALGAYFNGDWNHCWLEDGPQTATRLQRAIGMWTADVQQTMVLLNNPGIGGCGGGGRLTMPLGITWSTVAHEFGHALATSPTSTTGSRTPGARRSRRSPTRRSTRTAIRSSGRGRSRRPRPSRRVRTTSRRQSRRTGATTRRSGCSRAATASSPTASIDRW